MEEIIKLIKRRIAFHNKQFNRYRDEVDKVQEMKYISKRNLSQSRYSWEMSGRELAIIDELDIILAKLNSTTANKPNKNNG